VQAFRPAVFPIASVPRARQTRTVQGSPPPVAIQKAVRTAGRPYGRCARPSDVCGRRSEVCGTRTTPAGERVPSAIDDTHFAEDSYRAAIHCFFAAKQVFPEIGVHVDTVTRWRVCSCALNTGGDSRAFALVDRAVAGAPLRPCRTNIAPTICLEWRACVPCGLSRSEGQR